MYPLLQSLLDGFGEFLIIRLNLCGSVNLTFPSHERIYRRMIREGVRNGGNRQLESVLVLLIESGAKYCVSSVSVYLRSPVFAYPVSK